MVEFETKCLFIFWRTWKILGTWGNFTEKLRTFVFEKGITVLFYRCRTKNPKEDDDGVVTH